MKLGKYMIACASVALLAIASSCEEDESELWDKTPDRIRITDSYVNYGTPGSYNFFGELFSDAEGLDRITALKISGWMMDEDFRVIRNCPNLMIADFSDAVMDGASDISFAGLESLQTVVFPKRAIGVGTDCFKGCKALRYVLIPEMNKYGLIDSSAFQNLLLLEEVKMADSGIEYIGEDAFFNCISLRKVVLPSSLEAIAPGAFAYCESLEEIRVEATIPPLVADDTFHGVNRRECTLTVPQAAVEAYRSDSSWGEFGEIVGY